MHVFAHDSLLAASVCMMLCMLSNGSSAQTLCAQQSTCANHTWAGAIRTPYYGKVWYRTSVPQDAWTLFNGDQTAAFQELCARAITTWRAISDTLPHDVVGPSTAPFGWGWATTNQIMGMTNRRHNIPAAATENSFNDAQRPCKISGSLIFFSTDPQDHATQQDYFWSDSCSGGCLSNALDFLGAAVHEYGHALGLAHVPDQLAIMYPSLQGGVERNDPSECECDFVRQIFRDNFGPAALDSFAIQTLPTGEVACKWSVNAEQGCRRYRISKSCADGTAYVLADSMPCLGPGIAQTVVDPDVCPGMTLYSISIVDSIGPNLLQEVVLAERGYIVDSGPSAFHVAAVAEEGAVPPSGFETAEQAVEGLGVAVTGRNEAEQQRLRADGFLFYVRDESLFWGRAIDSILEKRLLACLASQDSTIDSLAFVPGQVVFLAESLAQVTANVRYVHRCQTAETDWAGQVVAIVERRFPEDGWRIRQVTELW